VALYAEFAMLGMSKSMGLSWDREFVPRDHEEASGLHIFSLSRIEGGLRRALEK
jgi:hypothetical protein